MKASDFYSMTAFDNAVNFLMPEIKVINNASTGYIGKIPRPEQIKMVAYKYFMIDQSTITQKHQEAFDVLRQCGQSLTENGAFKFGSKCFDSND
jgi:hypothetical protein